MTNNLSQQVGKLGDKAATAVDAAAEQAKDMAHRASAASQQAGKLGDKAAATIDTAADQAKDMAQRAASVAQETVRTASETGAAAWEVAQKAGAEAYARGERGARELAERIEQRPIAALLIAGALGYAVAYLVHGRD
jgi:hypothetical protein